LQHHRGALDAILMDISLPGKSGLEVAQEIHALEGGRWARVPVIVMSAHVSTQSQAARLAVGLASFLSKPFTLDKLAKTLGDVALADLEPDSVTAFARTETVLGEAWLDEAFLVAETETLGAPMLTELLVMFCESWPDALSQMETALQDQAWQELGKLAHRLRSAAANLGLTEVIAQTRALELAAGGDTPDDTHIARLLARLNETVLGSCQALQQHLAGLGR
jgi:two-component system sensor histidine kinase TorS